MASDQKVPLKSQLSEAWPAFRTGLVNSFSEIKNIEYDHGPASEGEYTQWKVWEVSPKGPQTRLLTGLQNCADCDEKWYVIIILW